MHSKEDSTVVMKKELRYLLLARIVHAKESALAVVLFQVSQFLRCYGHGSYNNLNERVSAVVRNLSESIWFSMSTARDVMLYQPTSHTPGNVLLAVLMKISCEIVILTRVIITSVILHTVEGATVPWFDAAGKRPWNFEFIFENLAIYQKPIFVRVTMCTKFVNIHVEK
jgi:hypothetical protein